MSSRSVSDIQTRAEGEKNDPSYEFIGEVILKINNCLCRENQNCSLCKSGQIFIRFTNID